MSRFARWTLTWAVALSVGFAIVFTLGRPLPTEAEELAAAYQPQPPVSQAVAERSAATIVRLEYPDLIGSAPTVVMQTDFGVERWVISYTTEAPVLSGVHVSVDIERGTVEVVAFP